MRETRLSGLMRGARPLPRAYSTGHTFYETALGTRLRYGVATGCSPATDTVTGRISRLSVASGARSAGQQSGTGILPVDARQGTWGDAHATCATDNREMWPL